MKLGLYNITYKAALKYGAEVWVLSKKGMSAVRNRRNEISGMASGTDKVRPSKEYNNSKQKAKGRTHSRWKSELSEELATAC
jgi:hypothetical protein